MTSRLEEINKWLLELFPKNRAGTEAGPYTLKYIASDASARNYLRCVVDGESYIIMDTVPGQEQINFVKIAKILAANNVNAPKIINNNLELGLILMNDFGNNTYLSLLDPANPIAAEPLYFDAIRALIAIQNIPKDAIELPTMDDAYIENRLQVFKTWYLQKHLNLDVDNKTENLLSDLFEIFTTAFSELPQVFVHLDYHSRNLMYLPTADNPGILDFQDAMFGPMMYDLVSLFQDAYITWPRQQVEQWVQTYHDMAVNASLLEPQDFNVVMRNFDLVGLQRHIKNLGVFARLNHRDNKPGYLNHIPTLLTYIRDTCSRYPELSGLQQYLSANAAETINI